MSDEFELSGPIMLDLGAVKDEPVPEGWHTVKIESADPGLSRQKKVPKVFVLSRINDEADPDFNRTIIWNCMLEGDGLIFTKRCFKALGLPEVLNRPSYEALAEDLVGREVECRVKHRVYQGEKQASVTNWRAVSYDLAF